MLRLFSLILYVFILYGSPSEALPLKNLQLPPEFTIHVFAEVPNARSMTLGEHTIFVGTRSDKIYAIIPNKNLTRAEKIYTIVGLNQPNGVAFYQGNLYVAEPDRIIAFNNIESHLQNLPKPSIILDNLPNEGGHNWRYLKMSPDGWLYFSLGAPCNVCVNKNPQFATIMRVRPDGKQLEIFAEGVRNSVGFAWDPRTKELWFTDNGRDYLGDDVPPDELNHAPQKQLHFGFPYFHGKNIADPYFTSTKSSSSFVPPAIELGPHVAALGMIFYTGHTFPEKYWNQVFIAEHGSWNRSSKIGYRIMWVEIQNNKAISYQPFITGWLQGENVWGRPVDLLNMPDGSLLISDDFAGVIYQVNKMGQKK